MKIALFGNEFSEQYVKYIKHLIKKLQEENIEVSIHFKFYDFLKSILRSQAI